MPRSLSTRTRQLNLSAAERDKLANLLTNYVPAGGLKPEREQEKFLETIWEMMVIMDAEKQSISSFERDIESSGTSGDSMETEGGDQGEEGGDEAEDGTAGTWDMSNDGWGVWESKEDEKEEEEGEDVKGEEKDKDGNEEEGEKPVGFVSAGAFRLAEHYAAANVRCFFLLLFPPF